GRDACWWAWTWPVDGPAPSLQSTADRTPIGGAQSAGRRPANRMHARASRRPAMSLPTTMRFVDHGAGGKPDVLRIAEGPVPAVGPGDILVRVAWAGVNRPDCAQRSGSYPPPPGASKILGLEAAGEVVAVGPDTARWKVGDKVCAL